MKIGDFRLPIFLMFMTGFKTILDRHVIAKPFFHNEVLKVIERL